MPSFKRWQEWAVPVALLGGVFVILTPLPTTVIDFLLASNMILAIMILSAALFAKSSAELSVFPAILLVSTLGRLVLNISTTRLILSNGTTTEELAAGGIIRSFGDYVIGDDVLVGLVIFGIVFIVQFVVVTKGSSRISEVAARFALDGLPGKQMAIDADLKSGLITAEQARQQREEVQQKADFLGAMDGAGRFVRGDAIAGLVITLVNIFGGLAIGLLNGMSFTSAVDVYTKLTIGDGLASQLPAFLVAIAAGILVARGSSRSSVSEEMVSQLGADPRVLFIAGFGAVAMIFAGLPPLPLIVAGIICVGLGLQAQSTQKEIKTPSSSSGAPSPTGPSSAGVQKKPARETGLEACLQSDPVEIRLGARLVPLADPRAGGTLFENVSELRRSVLKNYGFVIPKVRIADDASLKDHQLQIRIHGDIVCEATIPTDRDLALDRGRVKAPLEGQSCELEIGNGYWIDPAEKHRAEFFRYQVLDPVRVVIQYLRHCAIMHAADLFTRDAAGQLIDEVKKQSPVVVAELIPAKMSLSEVQQVLKKLLAERVSIRQLALILETLGDYSPHINQVDDLVEVVRQKMSRSICSRLVNHDVLEFLELEESVEKRLADQIAAGKSAVREFGEAEFKWFAEQISGYRIPGRELVLVIDPEIRSFVRNELVSWLPELNVLGRNEICRDMRAERIARISLQSVVRSQVA